MRFKFWALVISFSALKTLLTDECSSAAQTALD